MKNIIFLLTLAFLCPSPGTALEPVAAEKSARTLNAPLKADVILIAVPIRAKSILAGGTVNVLEKSAGEMSPTWTSVLFRVERVFSGDFKVPKTQEASLWSQMKDAADDKNILKLLTMDFEKPGEEGSDKGWLSMAVVDPDASFGTREGEETTSRERYKLSLARVHKDPDSYVLVKSEKLS